MRRIACGPTTLAPFVGETSSRDVYLPPGRWIDYQTSAVYEGGTWHHIGAAPLPVVMLVRESAVLPHITLAQSTAEMYWSELELVSYIVDGGEATGFVALPPEAELHEVTVAGGALTVDALGVQVAWTVTPYAECEAK